MSKKNSNANVRTANYIRLLAFAQSFGFSAYAFLLFYDPWMFGGDSICKKSVKMAVFNCIPFEPAGLIFGKTILIATTIIKILAFFINFVHKPEIWKELHRMVTNSPWYSFLKAFVLLFVWVTTVTNTELLLKCNRIESEGFSEWDFGQVSFSAT